MSAPEAVTAHVEEVKPVESTEVPAAAPAVEESKSEEPAAIVRLFNFPHYVDKLNPFFSHIKAEAPAAEESPVTAAEETPAAIEETPKEEAKPVCDLSRYLYQLSNFAFRLKLKLRRKTDPRARVSCPNSWLVSRMGNTRQRKR